KYCKEYEIVKKPIKECIAYEKVCQKKQTCAKWGTRKTTQCLKYKNKCVEWNRNAKTLCEKYKERCTNEQYEIFQKCKKSKLCKKGRYCKKYKEGPCIACKRTKKNYCEKYERKCVKWIKQDPKYCL